MTTERRHIHVSGIPVEIVRKDIKNLHLGVYPPSGRVRVAAPLRLDDEAVRLAVVSRLGWIRRQQTVFEQQDRQSEREMLTGESHYFQGRRYRLNVVEHDAPPSVACVCRTTRRWSCMSDRTLMRPHAGLRFSSGIDSTCAHRSPRCWPSGSQGPA